MKCLAVHHLGFSDICAHELEELGAKIILINDAGVEFEASPEKICEILYLSQSATKFLLGITSVKLKDEEDLLKLIYDFDFPFWTTDKENYRISTQIEENNLTAFEVIDIIGDELQKKSGLKVKLEEYDLNFFIYISKDIAYFGIDPLSFDLSKRSYKIFHSAASLKGTFAYSFLRFSGYSGKESLLDPCGGSGIIPIEAALFATSRSPNYFRKDSFRLNRYFKELDEDAIYSKLDKKIKSNCPIIYCYDRLLPQVKATQKNAKIAGIDKHIIASKYDLEWLDIKLEENSLQYIVTQPPLLPSGSSIEKKFYDELFRLGEIILKKKGIIALLCMNPISPSIPTQYNFSLIIERKVFAGKQSWQVLKFQKL